ncbi:MAG TPA: hypothetical protein VKZ18_00655 [Polyangia bacterium]|nr:hypothetical protein [Polyangia bacterium]
MRFVLVNESQSTAANQGGTLTPAILQDIAVAVSWQLNGDVAAEWGGTGSYSLRVGQTNGSDVQPTEVAIWIKDALPDAPGAAGYHDRLGNGASVVYIGRDGSDSLTQGANALSVTISHECCEAAGDPPANFWADRGDGNEEALELCDRVEDTSYAAPNGVTVSNFLLRAAFDPGAPSPYDKLGALKDRTGMTPGGYVILRTASSDEHQQTPGGGASAKHRVSILGNIRKQKLSKKKNPTSRTYKRGVRL